MFEIGFLYPKSGKEIEKRRIRIKTDFGAKRNGLQANHFLKRNCLILCLFLFIYIYIYIFSFLSCRVLKVAYDFSCPVLVAFKLIVY